jgi:hypothetical protein
MQKRALVDGARLSQALTNHRRKVQQRLGDVTDLASKETTAWEERKQQRRRDIESVLGSLDAIMREELADLQAMMEAVEVPKPTTETLPTILFKYPDEPATGYESTHDEH